MRCNMMDLVLLYACDVMPCMLSFLLYGCDACLVLHASSALVDVPFNVVVVLYLICCLHDLLYFA